MKFHFPRVLIISGQPFSLHTNNGKTLYSLFKDWPANNLAQLYFQDETPCCEKFSNFFLIRDLDIVKRALGLNVVVGRKVEPALTESGTTQVNSKVTIKKEVTNLLRQQRSALNFIRNTLYNTRKWDTSDLQKWLDNFKPEIIFFAGGDAYSLYDLMYSISESRRIPFTIYFADDYFLYNKGKGIFSGFMSNILKQSLEKYIQLASHLFVIGEQMGKEYLQLFSKEFTTIMNCVDLQEMPTLKIREIKEPIILRYVGGLYLERWKALVELGRLLAKLNIKTIVEIYSIDKPTADILSKLNEKPLVYSGPLYGEQVQKKINDADFLLHVESNDDRFKSITKLSVSTKIPQYLASGRCLIASGPGDVASIKLLAENNLAIIISDSNSENENLKKLQEIFTSSELYMKTTKRAVEFVYNNLNGITMRKNLLQTLNHIVKNHVQK